MTREWYLIDMLSAKKQSCRGGVLKKETHRDLGEWGYELDWDIEVGKNQTVSPQALSILVMYDEIRELVLKLSNEGNEDAKKVRRAWGKVFAEVKKAGNTSREDDKTFQMLEESWKQDFPDTE